MLLCVYSVIDHNCGKNKKKVDQEATVAENSDIKNKSDYKETTKSYDSVRT